MRQHTTGGSDLEKKIEKLWFHLRTSESPYHVDIFQFSVFFYRVSLLNLQIKSCYNL